MWANLSPPIRFGPQGGPAQAYLAELAHWCGARVLVEVGPDPADIRAPASELAYEGLPKSVDPEVIVWMSCGFRAAKVDSQPGTSTAPSATSRPQPAGSSKVLTADSGAASGGRRR
ncbi:hypothetical protein EBN03_15425 [Nocardia stercoris]|uniref:Uncharacterized protein n=1 Tax=Nocardia stercoris TaxID=2483361 RepID=A0A3M2L8U4_9NOCA|nr:hypothetical protein EBN03_15425 [Nocardia stercoris]